MDVAAIEQTNGAYSISTERTRLDLELVHRYLSEETYWAQGISLAKFERAARHSLCFGMYYESHQCGFARAVTDYATFAYLADVFVLPAHRGQGLGVWLMKVIGSHPELCDLRRWMLATRDAHGLYEKFGYVVPANPNIFMERMDSQAYLRSSR